MVFQKRRQQLSKVWLYNNEALEVVDSFCNLGLNLKYTGNIEFTTKFSSDQALRVANGLLALFNRLSFIVRTKLNLFDS